MNRFNITKALHGVGLLRLAVYFIPPTYAVILNYRDWPFVRIGYALAFSFFCLLCFNNLFRPHERRNAILLILSDLLMIGYSIFAFSSWELYPLYFMPMSVAGLHFKPWVIGAVGLAGIVTELLIMGPMVNNVWFYLFLHLAFTTVFMIILLKIVSREKQERRERTAMNTILHELREAHDYLKARNHDLAYMARTDALTKVYNYRYFEENLRKYVEIAKRLQHPVSLLMIDIDHFKALNDTFGHPSGDQALKNVADIIRENVRFDDPVCRYGGEEFAVILPRTGLQQAGEMAERIRCAIRDYSNGRPDFGQITVSIGVSSFPIEAKDRCELVESADRALYEAKRQGRDRVIFNRILTPSSP